MPDLAFTTVALVILVFPGYLFRSFYFSNEFTRHLLPKSWTEDIAKAILYSLPFHALWVLIFELLHHSGLLYSSLTFEILLRLVVGQYAPSPSDAHSFGKIAGELFSNKWLISIYYLLVLASSAFAGWGLRQIIWHNELDIRFTSLKYKSDWLYKLLGRGQLDGVSHKDIATWVDALTDQETEIRGKTTLYRGIVAGFTTESDGNLRDLILVSARRGKFSTNENGKYVFEWESVPGDYFVLRYASIRNLNITYFSKSSVESNFESPSPEPPVDLARP